MAGKEARQRQAWLPQGCVVVLTLWVADFDSWQYRVSMLLALVPVGNLLMVYG